MGFKTIKCPMCGNSESSELTIIDNKVVCGYCDSIFFNVDSEIQSRLNNALDYRTLYKFEEADCLYKEIAEDAEDMNDCETYCIALWGRLLCQFGVVYIKGFDINASPVPTFSNYDNNFDSILKCDFYRDIMESDVSSIIKDNYYNKAKKLDEIYTKIGKELKEKPEYDVFICTKITSKTKDDPNIKGYTEDSKIADKLYKELVQRGLKVFYSDKCCRGISYDSQIFSALLKSKNILVISTTREYLESCWVQSEWRRWINFIRCGEKNKDSIYLYLPYYSVKQFTLPRILNRNKIQYFTYDKELEMLDLISKKAILDEDIINKDSTTINKGNRNIKEYVKQKVEEPGKDYKSAEKNKEIIYENSNLDDDKHKLSFNNNFVSESETESVKWYIRAAKQRDVNAQYRLGYCYEKGIGVTKNYGEAIFWYRKAAEKGHVQAQISLGECYYYGKLVTRNYAEAVKWYSRAAELGQKYAQYNLGYCYENGQGIKKDINLAVKWYSKSAEQGDANAQYKLGNCYYFGFGIKMDYIKAINWYRKAAAQGNANAQYKLGYFYENGYAVTQSYEKAISCYRSAATQGNVNSQYKLGYYYEYGYGVTKNETEAIKWYSKAAEQGDIDAQYKLGYCYEYGYGVQQSYEASLQWYVKASNLGHVEAQYRLGKCYQHGYGRCQKNLQVAAKYYRMVNIKGHTLTLKEKWIAKHY